MFGAFFPQPLSTPCSDCGATVVDADVHECSHHRLVARFEEQLREWLGSKDGRFAVWLAEQGR